MSHKFLKILTLLAYLSIGGCAFAPQPMAPEDQKLLLLNDRIRASRDVEPLGSSLSLSEAIARGLKYNLDHRSKMLEQTIALGTYELSNYDMLPKILATAGYNYRNNWFITNATGAYSGQPSLNEPFIMGCTRFSRHGLKRIALPRTVPDSRNPVLNVGV